MSFKRCAAVAGVLLVHCNLLLVMLSGGALAMAARLRWDPSLYLLVREAASQYYVPAGAVLLATALATLLLAHLALAAISMRPSLLRRSLLLLYAALTAAQVCAELLLSLWLWARVSELQRGRDQLLAAMAAAHDHLLAALQLLAAWHPLPDKLHALVQEVEEDLPCNAFAAGGAAASMLVLQLGGVLLALLAAAAPRPPPPRAPSAGSLHTDDSDYLPGSRMRLTFRQYEPYEPYEPYERAPLRTTYKNGRLVVR